MINLRYFLNSIFFTVLVVAQYRECALDLFPLPHQCIVGIQQSLMIPNPCLTLFRIYGNVVHEHFFEITKFNMQKTFKCQSINMVPRNRLLDNDTLSRFQYIVDIVASDTTLKNPTNISQETYIINMTSKSALLYVASYPAYVRSLETYLQLFKYNATAKAYLLNNLPLSIADQPRFPHRGVMIDTARHYLPYELILDTIDSLAYNKLNVLHWHITDQDSFPLQLDSHPELAQFGAFSNEQVYTVSQVKNIIHYGMLRGVRVIPQLDTPGHAASWRLAPKNREIACVIDNWGYWGGLDVTLTKTYNLVREVFKQIISLFPDSYIHLGGDQVQLSCYRNLTQLTKAQNVTYQDLHQYYRKKQKQIINQLNNTKQTIYWVNQNNFTAQQNDVIQWWGGSNLPNTTAKVIVSMYGPYYLDMGVGNIFAHPYGMYSTWQDLYNQNLANQIMNYTNSQNVIGGQVLLWSQLSNKYTHMIKLWLRSSAFAQRMWNPNIEIIRPRVIARLNSQMRRLNTRGIPTAPIVSQKCQMNPQFC